MPPGQPADEHLQHQMALRVCASSPASLTRTRTRWHERRGLLPQTNCMGHLAAPPWTEPVRYSRLSYLEPPNEMAALLANPLLSFLLLPVLRRCLEHVASRRPSCNVTQEVHQVSRGDGSGAPTGRAACCCLLGAGCWLLATSLLLPLALFACKSRLAQLISVPFHNGAGTAWHHLHENNCNQYILFGEHSMPRPLVRVHRFS